MVVIYNAAHPRFHEKLPSEAEIAQVRNQYSPAVAIFSFSRRFRHNEKRSHSGGCVCATSDDAPPLVLAGEHKWDFARRGQIGALGLGKRVLCPGAIADQDLPAVYQGAMALVHPSRYEGFGLQLVEAMASGFQSWPPKPQVCLRCSTVAGGFSIPKTQLPSRDRWNGSVAIRSYRSLAESGRRRALFFSWHKAAEQTLRLYQELLGRGDEILRISNRESQEQPR